MFFKSVLCCLTALALTAAGCGSEFVNVLSLQWSYLPPQKNSEKELTSVPAGAKNSLWTKIPVPIQTSFPEKNIKYWTNISSTMNSLWANQTIVLGIGAEWWFEACLNSKVICSAMDNRIGNGKYIVSFRNHMFTVHAPKGKNVLAVFVRTGNRTPFLPVKICRCRPLAAPLNITADASKITGNIKLMNCSSGWNGTARLVTGERLKTFYAFTA